jgi:hypothetical protein
LTTIKKKESNSPFLLKEQITMPSAGQFRRYIEQITNSIPKVKNEISECRDEIKKEKIKGKKDKLKIKLDKKRDLLKELQTKLTSHKANLKIAVAEDKKSKAISKTPTPKKRGRPAKATPVVTTQKKKAGRPKKTESVKIVKKSNTKPESIAGRDEIIERLEKKIDMLTKIVSNAISRTRFQ